MIQAYHVAGKMHLNLENDMFVEISKATHTRLNKIMKQDETIELVIRRLLENLEEAKFSTPSESQSPPPPIVKGKLIKFGANHTIPAKFSRITRATLDGKQPEKLNWNPLMILMLRILSQKGIPIDASLHPELRFGNVKKNDQGYMPCQILGVAVQNVEANRAARIIQSLAVRYKISVDIRLRWPEKKNLKYPGESGHIEIN